MLSKRGLKNLYYVTQLLHYKMVYLLGYIILQPQVINIHICKHNKRTSLLGNIIDQAFCLREFPQVLYSKLQSINVSQITLFRLKPLSCLYFLSAFAEK